MLKFFSTLLIIFSFSALFALADVDLNKSPSWLAPLANKSLLLDIDIVSDNRIVAVGAYGHILFSSDGDNWEQVNAPIKSTLTAVYFLNDQLGWAVGHDAAILHTQDSGVTWEVQQYLPSLEKPLFDIVFNDTLNGVAIGSYGLFFRTNDGGKTWISEFHDEFLLMDDIEYLNELREEDEDAYLDEIGGILPHFNRIKAIDKALYLVGEIGLIAKSDDFGVSWEPIDEIYHGSFFDITSTQKGTILTCGLRGHIFYSENEVQNWTLSQSNTTSLLNTIVENEQGELYILGNNGVLIKSIDDGRTFTEHHQADGKSLIDGIWFNQKLIVVSDIGIKHITLLK